MDDNKHNTLIYTKLVLEHGVQSPEATAYFQEQVRLDPRFGKRASVIQKLANAKTRPVAAH